MLGAANTDKVAASACEGGMQVAKAIPVQFCIALELLDVRAGCFDCNRFLSAERVACDKNRPIAEIGASIHKRVVIMARGT